MRHRPGAAKRASRARRSRISPCVGIIASNLSILPILAWKTTFALSLPTHQADGWLAEEAAQPAQEVGPSSVGLKDADPVELGADAAISANRTGTHRGIAIDDSPAGWGLL